MEVTTINKKEKQEKQEKQQQQRQKHDPNEYKIFINRIDNSNYQQQVAMSPT